MPPPHNFHLEVTNHETQYSLCHLLNQGQHPLQGAAQQVGGSEAPCGHSWRAAQGCHGCRQRISGHLFSWHNLHSVTKRQGRRGMHHLATVPVTRLQQTGQPVPP